MASVEVKKQPRTVRFPVGVGRESESEVILVPSRQELTEEDKKNLWFARSDYHFSRTTARVISKESERYGYSKNLDAVYGIDSSVVQERLNAWVFHGHSRRGLERWANSAHGEARKEDQYRYIKGVVKAFQEMKLTGEVDAERLREVGDKLSHKSRLFAKMLGDADAHAAKCSFGLVDSPAIYPICSKNFGLSPGAKINRVSDFNASHRPRFISDGSSPSATQQPTPPKFSINGRRRSGRVPRMA